MAYSRRTVKIWLRHRRGLDRQAWLREVIARCAGCPTADVSIAFGPFGKPHCAGPTAARGWQFSLSSSGDLVALAVTTGPVGVDVEQCRPHDVDAIGQAWFSPHEQRWLDDVPDADRQSAFLRIWCRKEAVVKATGVGIDGGFADFSVVPRVDDGGVQADLKVRLYGDADYGNADTEADPAWRLWDLDLPSGYVGALAAAPDLWEIEVVDCR
jgi:phosphopantetheinyl transferase